MEDPPLQEALTNSLDVERIGLVPHPGKTPHQGQPLRARFGELYTYKVAPTRNPTAGEPSLDRGFSFHVPVPEDSSLAGFIMVEQVKSVDFRTRRAKRIERASDGLLANVLSLLDACIY